MYKNCLLYTSNLIVAQPDTGEQALEIAEALVRSGALDIIVVDSVAALVPKAEIDGDMGDSHIGLQARLMSQALRKLAGAINKSKCVIVFINQLREKVGIMFGNPETTTGGRALKYYSSVRLDIRKIENLKQDGEVVGNRARVKVCLLYTSDLELRGTGEFFGTKQHGIPDFKIANLFEDIPILKMVQDLSKQIEEEDPRIRVRKK